MVICRESIYIPAFAYKPIRIRSPIIRILQSSPSQQTCFSQATCVQCCVPAVIIASKHLTKAEKYDGFMQTRICKGPCQNRTMIQIDTLVYDWAVGDLEAPRRWFLCRKKDRHICLLHVAMDFMQLWILEIRLGRVNRFTWNVLLIWLDLDDMSTP
jgi:hypothetical protein